MTDHELLQALYNDMQGMKNDMQVMKDDIQGMKDDMQGMKDDMQGMKDDMQGMQGMKDDIQTLKADMRIVKQKVTDIELHIENVTDKNIQIIAEGHLNLDRKLNEALKVEKDKEMLMIRVNILEDELRKLKERSAQSA